MYEYGFGAFGWLGAYASQIALVNTAAHELSTAVGNTDTDMGSRASWLLGDDMARVRSALIPTHSPRIRNPNGHGVFSPA